jgi:hypothetical protein
MVRVRELGVSAGQPNLPSQFKGKRPTFFDDPAIDALLAMLLELAQETWTLRERLTAYESYLASKGVSLPAEFEAYQPPDGETADLAARRQAFIARLFRVLERPD